MEYEVIRKQKRTNIRVGRDAIFINLLIALFVLLSVQVQIECTIKTTSRPRIVSEILMGSGRIAESNVRDDNFAGSVMQRKLREAGRGFPTSSVQRAFHEIIRRN